MAFNLNTPVATNQVAADLVALNANWEYTAPGVVTTAGDIVYATALNTITRLAIGAANTKLFTNAGATAPEWTTGLKIGTFQIDTATATGTQAITGVGFKPTTLVFLAGINGTGEVSIGFDDGTSKYSIANAYGVSAGTWSITPGASIFLSQSAGVSYGGYVSVLGADGFTVSWTKTGGKTGTAGIYYLAIR